jgi:tetratricopeptide (TPR) repeat protein
LVQVQAELRRQQVKVKLEGHLGKGQILLKQGKYEEARRSFEEVLKLDSNQGEAQTLLSKARDEMERAAAVHQGLIAGRRAWHEGELTLSESELRRVLDLDGDNREAQTLLAEVRQERAAQEKRLRLRQGLWQGRNLLVQGRCEEALEELQRLQQEFSGEQELHELLQRARSEVNKRSQLRRTHRNSVADREEIERGGGATRNDAHQIPRRQ